MPIVPPLSAIAHPAGAKPVTAMVRIRNEAEFLDAAVRSIIDLVNHVVPVDNPRKFCKAGPWAGYGPDLVRVIAGNVALGLPMPTQWCRVLERVGHV